MYSTTHRYGVYPLDKAEAKPRKRFNPKGYIAMDIRLMIMSCIALAAIFVPAGILLEGARTRSLNVTPAMTNVATPAPLFPGGVFTLQGLVTLCDVTTPCTPEEFTIDEQNPRTATYNGIECHNLNIPYPVSYHVPLRTFVERGPNTVDRISVQCEKIQLTTLRS